MNAEKNDAYQAHELLAEAERISAVLAEHAARHDRDATFPIEGLAATIRSPINTALLGGAAGDDAARAPCSWLTFGRIVALLARGDASFATAWLMHQGAMSVYRALVDPGERSRFEQAIRRGAWVGNALSEPTSGNMFLVPRQVARKAEGGYRLTGEKRFVTGCEHADFFFTAAVCDGQPAFFLLDKDDSIAIEPVWDTLGMRATRSQIVRFQGTLLPESRRLAVDPTAPNPIPNGLGWLSVGIAEAAMAAAGAYAKERVLPPGDRPIAELQWVQFAVADMSLRLEAARALAMRTAAALDAGDPSYGLLQLQSKVVANEAAVAIATSALEIAGGAGYMRSRPIERHLRDAMSGPIMALSGPAIRDIVGKALLGVA
ncbi:Acyl-CoA dehydrogenase [Sorangium cellulosum So ce56]|uniref:Acyl-CoA dehydrogenase n=1 Tax=Sorangium cellulosum (strain So ce56) TaxID=448385 RepID=A9G541_SORC5|nr:acyl-CoA dehydrogenase [Sorangium cellulosum]CAN98973.1 Acyl-CoA dehydrogenase [Sorangium cellulosum So ce56]